MLSMGPGGTPQAFLVRLAACAGPSLLVFVHGILGYVGIREPDFGFQCLDQLIYDFDPVPGPPPVDGSCSSEAPEERRRVGTRGGRIEEVGIHVEVFRERSERLAARSCPTPLVQAD